MGRNDHIDFTLVDAIADLEDEGWLEKGTKEHGVAQQVADRGVDSLSPKQRVIWEKGVAPLLEKRAEELKYQDIANRADA